MAAAGRSFA